MELPPNIIVVYYQHPYSPIHDISHHIIYPPLYIEFMIYEKERCDIILF